MSRFLFASDLHGNTRAYRDLFDLEADAIVLGGDLLPHPPGRGDQLIGVQRRFAEKVLAPLFRLRPVYWLLGNDDWIAARSALEGLGTFIHDRAVDFLDGYTLVGYSCVPVTPFGMKDYDRYDSKDWSPGYPPKRCLVSGTGVLKETTLEVVRSWGTIEEDLAGLEEKSDPARTVYIMHSPPWDSGLDLMHGGKPVGSKAIRAFIETKQPPITLHGHIHESPGVVKIGKTVSGNPGDSLAGLRALEVDLADCSVTPLP